MTIKWQHRSSVILVLWFELDSLRTCSAFVGMFDFIGCCCVWFNWRSLCLTSLGVGVFYLMGCCWVWFNWGSLCLTSLDVGVFNLIRCCLTSLGVVVFNLMGCCCVWFNLIGYLCVWCNWMSHLLTLFDNRHADSISSGYGTNFQTELTLFHEARVLLDLSFQLPSGFLLHFSTFDCVHFHVDLRKESGNQTSFAAINDRTHGWSQGQKKSS